MVQKINKGIIKMYVLMFWPENDWCKRKVEFYVQYPEKRIRHLQEWKFGVDVYHIKLSSMN